MAATSGLAAFTAPVRTPGTEGPIVARFLVGYGALWLILTAGAESKTTAPAAAALAVSIAFGATVLYLADAATNLGLLNGGK